MKKLLLSFAILATFAQFTACGDDVTEVTEVHQDGMAVLDAGLELSKQKCDTSNVGEMLFVADSSEVFVCDGKTWQTLKGADGKPGENGDNGNDGTSCTASVNKDGDFDLVCGGKSVGTIKNGANGKDGLPGADGDNGNDGESCTAEPVKNAAGIEGLEVTCGKTVVGTIWNGEKGEPGVDGEDGNDGTSCTAEPVKNSAGLEGLEVTCGKTVVGTIWNGEKGEQGEKGEDGKNLVATPGTMGSFIDSRDGQVYKTVVVGSQTWMAQNLNYEYNYGTAKSYCYGVDPNNCDTYGRLYLWSAAMDSAEVFSTSGKGCGYGKTCSPSGTIRGVCPSGWHLPSYDEWQTLFENVGGEDVAGRMLKSEEGWNYYSESTKGIDYYGFSALPAGERNGNGSFNSAGDYTYFWSSSEGYDDFAYNMYLDYSFEFPHLYYFQKIYALSVRCLQD